MDVYIRRNLDIQFDCSIGNLDALRELVPEPTPEQKAKMEEGARKRLAVEEKIWQHIEANPMVDLSGNRITRETHEIGFDYDWVESEDGIRAGRAVKAWIRPKKSEYLMER